MEQEPEPYNGPFVVLRAAEPRYVVLVEPPRSDGAGAPRSYACKHSAWGAARTLWCDLRLPFRDETEGHFGNTNARKDQRE